MMKTLRQAELDDRGDVDAPCAHGVEQKPKIDGDEAKCADWGSTPTHSRGHDPQVAGEVKEWLDSIDELDGDFAWAETAKQLKKVNKFVCGLEKQNQFAEVALAQSKDPD